MRGMYECLVWEMLKDAGDILPSAGVVLVHVILKGNWSVCFLVH